MKATSGNHTTCGDAGAGRGLYNQDPRFDLLPSINIPGVKVENGHKFMSVTTLRRGLFRRMAGLAAGLLLLFGMAASGSADTVTLTVQNDWDDASESGYDPANWDNSSDPYLRVLQYYSGSQLSLIHI